jgi:hypothetical protein
MEDQGVQMLTRWDEVDGKHIAKRAFVPARHGRKEGEDPLAPTSHCRHIRSHVGLGFFDAIRSARQSHISGLPFVHTEKVGELDRAGLLPR